MIISTEFQTPEIVCNYMASLTNENSYKHYLEPTPGMGNLVKALQRFGVTTAPQSDFWDFYDQATDHKWTFDAVVMNPPFSPMVEGYRILLACMGLTNEVVALVPWLTLINSDKRIKLLQAYGLVSITHLPRKAFPGSRVQTCIIHLKKGYLNDTTFGTFNW